MSKQIIKPDLASKAVYSCHFIKVSVKIKALLFQESESCSQRMEASGLGIWGNPSALLNALLHLADQEERTKAIEAFRDGKKDVLVATDVASKGLDFPAIQHVINYDMPEEIENYGMKERDSWEVFGYRVHVLEFLNICKIYPL